MGTKHYEEGVSTSLPKVRPDKHCKNNHLCKWPYVQHFLKYTVPFAEGV